jgi:hypothetical protein
LDFENLEKIQDDEVKRLSENEKNEKENIELGKKDLIANVEKERQEQKNIL